MSNNQNAVSAALKRVSGNGNSAINTVLGSLSKTNIYRNSGNQNNSSEIKTSSNRAVLPDNSKLIERENVTDAELKKQAENYADERYNDRIIKEDSSSGKKLTDLNERLAINEIKGQAELTKARNAFLNESEKIKNSVVKQSLVNSSIYKNLAANSAADYEASRRQIEAELDITTAALKKEMDIVEQSRQLALRDFELKRAEEYEKKIEGTARAGNASARRRQRI